MTGATKDPTRPAASSDPFIVRLRASYTQPEIKGATRPVKSPEGLLRLFSAHIPTSSFLPVRFPLYEQSLGYDLHNLLAEDLTLHS